MPHSKFVIVTGMSGAGKSLASRCFEDLNFFVVDNLPPALLPKLAQLCGSSEIDNVALVIDIRGRDFFGDFLSALDQMRSDGASFQILFLDATDKVLVRRFSETRRKHPLSKGGRIVEAIEQERKFLAAVKTRADHIIDTSSLTPYQLKEEITAKIAPASKNGSPMAVTVLSFGFKYGLPLDADLVLDVRFLTNPYYVSRLRNLTGNDEEVQKYVLKQPKAKEFLDRLYSLTDFLIPQYVEEGKSQVTIAIGCTGGKHRSITLANELARHLQDQEYKVVVEHRDIVR